MPAAPHHPATVLLTRLGAFILIVAALYLASDVLIPLALAVLLSFILAPLVSRLERWGLGRIPSVIAVTAMAFILLAAIGFAVTTQVVELTQSLPEYRQNIKQRLRGLRAEATDALGRAAEMVQQVQQEVEQEQEAARDRFEPRGEQPVPVRIEQGPQTTLETLGRFLATLVGPFGTAAIVVIFVIFILIYRQELRDRVIRLIGLGRMHITTRALDEAADRISRYLLTQLLINTLYGIPVGIGLWLLGLPGAVLWGLLAIVLRFIPYLGPWLAAGLPIALSLAVFEGWTLPLAVAGLFIAMELLSNNVLEPWLYGSSTGLSPVAVLGAAVFWAWLWGPVGLLLAVPITACMVVLGRHVPHLEFLAILLGNEPALDSATRFYQRVLAGDDEEAMEIAEAHRKEHGLIDAYDHVVLPALHMHERDRHRGYLHSDEVTVLRCIQELIEELGESAKRPAAGGKGDGDHLPQRPEGCSPQSGSLPFPAPGNGQPGPVLCVPGRERADELAALMLAQAIECQGVRAERITAGELTAETLEKIGASRTPLVCLSDLPPTTISHARYVCKMVRRRFPQVRIIAGLWHFGGDMTRAESRLKAAGADQVVTTLRAVIDRLRPTLKLDPLPDPEPTQGGAVQTAGLPAADRPPRNASRDRP